MDHFSIYFPKSIYNKHIITIILKGLFKRSGNVAMLLFFF